MPYSQGLNFRATAGYVTDPTGYDVIINGGTSAYPYVTAQGNTVGWESALGVGGLDRDNTNIAQLAGVNYIIADNATFRMDLPAPGQYIIRLAAGDAVAGQPVAIDLFDNVSFLAQLSTGTTSTVNEFKDATDVQWANTAWLGSNIAITPTFTSSILRFTMQGVGSLCVIASFSVAQVARPWNYYAQQQ